MIMQLDYYSTSLINIGAKLKVHNFEASQD